MYSVALGMHRRGHMQEIVHCNHVCDKKQWKQQVALSRSDASLGWTTSLLKQRGGCALSTGVESALLYLLRKISKGQNSAYNLLPFVSKGAEDKNLYLYFLGFARQIRTDTGRNYLKRLVARWGTWMDRVRLGDTLSMFPFLC